MTAKSLPAMARMDPPLDEYGSKRLSKVRQMRLVWLIDERSDEIGGAHC